MKSFGELIARRREELGMTQAELAARVIGRRGEPVTQQRIGDIEHMRHGVPRLRVLKQLVRALKLNNIEVLYLWAGVIPPGVSFEGLSEEALLKAWRASARRWQFRSVIRAPSAGGQNLINGYGAKSRARREPGSAVSSSLVGLDLSAKAGNPPPGLGSRSRWGVGIGRDTVDE